MTISKSALWKRFLTYYREYPKASLSLDLSRVDWPDGFFQKLQPRVSAAFTAMDQLESGAIANPDENRRVGHYWLRTPGLSPEPEIKSAIESTLARIKEFAARVHAGRIHGQTGRFCNVIVIGIGGSALGPLFVSKALGNPKADKLGFFILDNTDPDGMDRVFAELGDSLGQTLSIVISKSGGTKETRNGMLEAKACYKNAGLSFAKHAVAITQDGSQLDKVAMSEGWLERFPMWDWVGGRTSELSAVGLLPAALQGFDIDSLLLGAREMDAITRVKTHDSNPAMGMALAWYASGNGKGDKNLVILPYKDRLELISKYLQQLIMESIGKDQNLEGEQVNQGLSVFGNKGSTDQHSFVQQLRDGRNDFIVTFIEVLKSRNCESIEVEDRLSSADYLQGFLLGTQIALTENDRESITITVSEVNAFTVGALIALFERTVGFYASLIGINAYHQPGVEAGKKAATEIVELKSKIHKLLSASKGESMSAQSIANDLLMPDSVESVFRICKRLSANGELGLSEVAGITPDLTEFKTS